jgi:NAD-dependent dihydropyrimidine dehydrogenase PreA subunit
MPYFIAAPCIDVMDKSCIEECPVDCIYEGERKLYINPVECIDCGACEPACPQSAIFVDWRAPEDTAGFAEDNKRFFSEVLPSRSEPIGNPGGSGNVGPVRTDTPMVRDWDGERDAGH